VDRWGWRRVVRYVLVAHVLSFAVAACAGFYIHYPSRWFLFGSMRGARGFKVVASDVLVLTFVALAGYALATGRWRQVLLTRADLPELGAALKYYCCMDDRLPRQEQHDAVQKLLWSLWSVLVPALAVTGALMFAPTPGWLLVLVPPGARRYIKGFPGPTGYQVRTAHFLLASTLVATALLQLYVAFNRRRGRPGGGRRGSLTGGRDGSGAAGR